ESIDIGNFIGLLNVGDNVLSVQALNASPSNPDFLFNAELVKRLSIVSDEHYYAVATPGAANSSSYFNQIDDLKFSKDHGFYDAGFDLSITSETPRGTLRYTPRG